MNKPVVQFRYQARIQIKQRNALKKTVQQIFSDQKVAAASITYIFCSDEFLLALNQQFLQHDTLTDIITFPLHEEGEAVMGEVYISVDRVKDNAKLYEVSTWTELTRVIFHGALHLCGFKDQTTTQSLQMRKLEDHYVQLVSRETP